MNHVSIFEKKWLDLVFEGKNKNYGAYQLRLQNPRTTIFALFLGLLFLGSVIGAGVLAAKLGQQTSTLTETLPDHDPLQVVKVDLTTEPPLPPSQNATPPVINNDPVDNNTRQLNNVEIVPREQANNVNLVNQPVAPESLPGTAGVPGNNPTPAGGGTPGNGTAPTPPDTPVPPMTLDKLPEYPGGINKFYKYVGDNFDKPDIDNVTTVSVIVSFVIEKDGAMTDIKVTRDPGYGMSREAIRVLKSLKVKWKPGIKNGEPVRTMYSLPITVKIN